MRALTVYFALMLYLTGSCWAGIVYSNDFSTSPGSALSLTSGAGALGLVETPGTCVSNGSAYCGTFLGLAGNTPLGTNQVTLSLTGLTPHSSMTVSFAFFALASWDGNLSVDNGSGGLTGPDIFGVKVDGVTQLYSSFSNYTTQSYPAAAGSGSSPAQTGAVETNKMGYTFVGDSVYLFSWTVDHVSENATITFEGIGLQAWGDEGWGIDNVAVSTNSIEANVPEPASFGLGAAAIGVFTLLLRHFRA